MGPKRERERNRERRYNGWYKKEGGETNIRAVGPCEDVREAPRSYLGFGFFAGGRRHGVE